MSDHPHQHQASRQRRVEFDILAPLVIGGLLLSFVAIVIAFSAAQSDDVTTAERAVDKAAVSSATETAAPPAAEESETLTADFAMKPYDPVTKPVQPGPKTFELEATEKIIDVDGTPMKLWTFNNTVPGPVLRAVVGDRITIRISNAKDSKFLHSVDYHASRMTLGGGHVQVKPGEEGVFEFTAEYPGAFMYHCATAPVLHHIGMGMYGMLIVQPKAGFGKPMPEYAITQSELYGSTEAIEAKAPAAMAFNGIPSQYVKAPIKVEPDSEARLFVVNAGPSEISSFHVVGTIFDRVLEDGNPRNATWGRQALAMPASGGGVFEMKFVGEGQFPFVTHQFNHAAMGAVGMILAGDGKPGPGGVDDPAAHGHS